MAASDGASLLIVFILFERLIERIPLLRRPLAADVLFGWPTRKWEPVWHDVKLPSTGSARKIFIVSLIQKGILSPTDTLPRVQR